MKSLYLGLGIITLILMTGCVFNDEKVEVISAEPSDYKIYLYNHLEDKEQSKHYLSALLDWKLKHENSDNDTLSFKESKIGIKDIKFEKDQLPALVISKNGKAVEIIYGKHSDEEEIRATLERTVVSHSK